ncbi:hypothetical protein HanIR_Chr15g0784241 [Helianthus annuus]|nr:hypothetical protein HanIR_Chr15g0784241 [Helianthus annuus]
MVASSTGFVSKAKTVFHSTTAKAEKVFTDIKKSDSSPDLDICRRAFFWKENSP